MPFELHDFQDLVRSLREHPDWREELRALLLTQELLTLPAVVRELTMTVAQLVEGQQRLTEGQLRLTDHLAQLTARVDQLTVTVTQLTEGQQRLTDRLEQLTEGQRRLEVHMGEVRGWTLEQRYRTHAPAYFGRLLRQADIGVAVGVGEQPKRCQRRVHVTERGLALHLHVDVAAVGRADRDLVVGFEERPEVVADTPPVTFKFLIDI